MNPRATVYDAGQRDILRSMTGPGSELAILFRERLADKHNSIRQAASALGIPYERLKQSLRRERFSAADAQKIANDVMDGASLEQLRREYGYEPTRNYTLSSETNGLPESDDLSATLLPLYSSFQSMRKIIQAAELNDLVPDIYGRWQCDMSMVLFCDGIIDPVEWDPNCREARMELYAALKRGGKFIYLFAEKPGVRSTSWDNIQTTFAAFCLRLEEEQSTSNALGSDDGFLVLLRVPTCSFCMPYQKTALFSRREDGNTTIRAVTTIDIPETIDGGGNPVTICFPLPNRAAKLMVTYLEHLTIDMKKSTENLQEYIIESYPPMDRGKLVARIRGIM